jgi:hypothetical protein
LVNKSIEHKQSEREHSRPVERLLYSRGQTAEALGGISIMTVIRMEQLGILPRVRLFGSRNGKVFHPAEKARALATAAHSERA